MKLIQLQQTFAQHLLHQPTDLDALKVTGPFSVEQLMGLYRNNFYISFLDYLTACFPSVQALVGEEFFAQLAKAFTKDKSLDCASIEHYGQQFANYIDHCEQVQALGYLADIARIDWAVDRAKSEIEFSPFPFEALGKLSPEQQMQAVFGMRENTVLMAANCPVFDIWQGVQDGCLDNIDMQRRQWGVIYSDQEFGAKCEQLSEQQFNFLTAVSKGLSLQQLAIEDDFQQHLQHFISIAVINNFTLQGEL